MSITNKCYQRKGLQDPNDPTKCLDVTQPNWVKSTDVYGNEWYDFNADFIKNGVVCDVESDPPTCEVLPTLVYNRKGLLDPNDPEECLDINPHENYIPRLAVICTPELGCTLKNDMLDYVRRDTDNNLVDTTVCPPKIKYGTAPGSIEVNISDLEFVTESGLLIESEQQVNLFFEPEKNTRGSVIRFTS